MKTVLLVLLIISVGLFIYRNKTRSNINTWGLEILHHLESPYQTIDLARDKKTNHVAMFLNGAIQNHTKEFNKSHYAMVDIPIKLLNTPLKKQIALGQSNMPLFKTPISKNGLLANFWTRLS